MPEEDHVKGDIFSKNNRRMTNKVLEVFAPVAKEMAFKNLRMNHWSITICRDDLININFCVSSFLESQKYLSWTRVSVIPTAKIFNRIS